MANRFWVPIAISAIANNGGGASRCTCTSTTNLSTSAFLFGVTGTTGLNGAQTITIIDATHFDVAAVPFVATGTGSVNGQWDANNTANWAASSGGAGGQTVPVAADAVIFDANSGAGTIVVAAAINGASNTIAGVSGSAYTGTLDFSVNNPTITTTTTTGYSFTFSASGTYKFGTCSFVSSGGAFTVAGTLTGTPNMTLNLPPTGGLSQTQFSTGAMTWNNITINAGAGRAGCVFGGAATTITTFNLNASAGSLFLNISSSTSLTVTTLNIIGTLTTPVLAYLTTQASTWGLNATTANISYAALRNCNSVGAITANNSWDFGINTNVTFNPPSAGGGGVIGG